MVSRAKSDRVKGHENSRCLSSDEFHAAVKEIEDGKKAKEAGKEAKKALRERRKQQREDVEKEWAAMKARHDIALEEWQRECDQLTNGGVRKKDHPPKPKLGKKPKVPVVEQEEDDEEEDLMDDEEVFQCFPDGQPLLVNNIGSFANVGTSTTINYLSWSGHCVVQTSKPDFEVDELLAMVNDEGLNVLFLYAPWFSKLLDIARTNEVLLSTLKSMSQINYTGAALNPDDEIWAMEQGIPVTNCYATTETAGCLVTPLVERDLLPGMRVMKGINIKFIPTKGLDTAQLDGDAQQRSQGGQLFDLFLPAEADNCPHPSIRNRPDGHITGDLFEEVKPGVYCFRGRNDDWIRTGEQICFCDTKSIEDNVLVTCADIVQNCIVVGHYKPVVVLFVEPIQAITPDISLRDEILKRTHAFNSRLFDHEQINSTLQIVCVPSGSLPRTSEKGNIRRKAVEDEYDAVLKEIYSNFK